MTKLSLPLLLGLLVTSSAAQDLTVSRIGKYNGKDDVDLLAVSGNIAAYSFATTSCNIGDTDLPWNNETKNAPLIGTNMLRVYQGRIEHLSYSFVKYGFCSADSDGGGCPGDCTDSTPRGCDTLLNIGCADVYSASLNDGRKGGAKWEIDPVTGIWPANPPTGPVGDQAIRGRIQVLDSEITDPEAVVIIEGQYISIQDHGAGNARDNYGWRPVEIAANLTASNSGPTQKGQPAIYAWQAYADGVLIDDLAVENEGGAGVHGWMFLGSRALDLGGGLWRYEFAVQNGNSGRGVGALSIPLPCDPDIVITDPFYRGVPHHSGSPYSNAAWTFAVVGDRAEWRTDDHASDPFASAIRWGELSSFGFTANRAPAGGAASLELFVPGTPTELTGQVIAPGALFEETCTANANSTGVPAQLIGAGSDSVTQAELSFTITELPDDSLGYLLMSQNSDFVPFFSGSQGNLCLGSPIRRFVNDVLDSGTEGEVSTTLDFDDLPGNVEFQPGERWFFQYWYRDMNPGSTSNTTPGVSVTFCD